jgi:hypothetical protein
MRASDDSEARFWRVFRPELPDAYLRLFQVL